VIKSRILFAAAVTTLALWVPAEAQTIPSPYAFVERGMGAYAYGTYVFTDRGVIELGPGSGPAAGIGYAARVSGPFVIDSRIAFFPTSRTVYDVEEAPPEQIRDDPRAGLVPIGEADLSLLLVDGSLRFDITGPRTWRNLQPYALLGAGVVFRLAADHSDEAELPETPDLRVRFRNGVTGHFGAGVEAHLTDRFTLRLDARSLFWRLHVPTGFITADRVLDDREWVQTGHISVGAGFRF
jgi:hypothetical protein